MWTDSATCNRMSPEGRHEPHSMTAAEQAKQSFSDLATLAGRIATEQRGTVVRLAGLYAAALKRGATLFLVAGHGAAPRTPSHIRGGVRIRFTTTAGPLRPARSRADTSFSHGCAKTTCDRRDFTARQT